MAKRKSAAAGPAGDPVNEGLYSRGGGENSALFQVIDQHLSNLGIPINKTPPQAWGIPGQDWARWLAGGAMAPKDRDQIAWCITRSYRDSEEQPDGVRRLTFEGLGKVANDLEQASASKERPANAQFFKAIEPHRNNLGWSEAKRLAAEWGCTESLISGFKSGTRAIQLDHVNRLAVAIARGYDALPEDAPTDSSTPRAKERYSTNNLHFLLDELMNAAGFSVFAGGREPNIVFERLRRREKPRDRILRVGYFWWPPMTSPSELGSVRGLARDITEVMAGLMSVELRWIPIRWPHVHSALAAGEIDLIPPIFLRLPVRMFDLALSNPIPHVSCSPTGLLNSEYLDRLKITPHIPRVMGDVDTSQIVWVVGKSQVTALLARLLDPQAVLDESGEFASIEEGWRDVINRPWDEDRKKVRVFPTEQLTAASARRHLQGEAQAATLLQAEQTREMGLGIACAAHYGEPKLIQVVNACLEELGRRPSYLNQVLAPYAALLRDAGAVPEALINK